MDALIVHENIFMYNFMHILTFYANFMDKMSSSVSYLCDYPPSLPYALSLASLLEAVVGNCLIMLFNLISF